MEDKNANEAIEFVEEGLDMLPEGWGEGDDFFNVDSWTGAPAADEQAEGETSQEKPETKSKEEKDSTTTAAEKDSSDVEKPTTQTGKGKLKFNATIDHESKDVELDETELPTIYQKAHATDRAQAKVAKMQPVYDQALRTAKILGYATVDEMLKAAEESYRDGEVERLVNEGAQKDVAEDLVRRKMNDVSVVEKDEDKPAEPKAAPNGRDFKSEVEALLELRPELKKPGTKLPDEVTSECVKTGRPLAVVYLEYEARQEKARYEELLKENKILKQNANAASRAPVRGVSRGGAPSKQEDDPFMAGFNSEF